MGVTKKVVTKGNGTDIPKKGDEVTIEYTGNLYDESKGEKADYRGAQYVPHPMSANLPTRPSAMLTYVRLPPDSTPLKDVEISRLRLAWARSSKVAQACTKPSSKGQWLIFTRLG